MMIYSMNFSQDIHVVLFFVAGLLRKIYFGGEYYYISHSFMVQRDRMLQPCYMKKYLVILCCAFWSLSKITIFPLLISSLNDHLHNCTVTADHGPC